MSTFKNKESDPLRIVFWMFFPILFILFINFGGAYAQLDSAIDSYETLYQDDFSDETTGWYIKQDILDSGTYTYSLTDGTYRWEYELKQGYYRYILLPGRMNLPDDGFRISIDIQFESAFSGTDAGIIFNFQDKDNFYFARLDTQGIASIYAKENGKWVLLSEKIQSEKFDPSGINNMTVVYDTGNYEIRINDIPTVRLSDNRFHGGTVALNMEGKENTNPIIRFDNLTIMKKKSAQAETENKTDAYETVYQDDFSNETTDWNLKPVQGDWGAAVFSITDGMYRLGMNLEKSQFRYVPLPSKINLPSDSFRISADIQFETTCSSCAAGVIYNLQDSSNFYFARLDTQGIASIYAKENGKWVLLSEKIQSEEFDPSGINNMTVVYDTGNYEIRINDIPTVHLADSRFQGGTVGLSIEGGEKTNPTARFDNLTIMKKKSAQAETEQGKEKTNVEIKTEMESEAPAHLNQVITPMNNFYPPQEKVAFTKYFLDFSSPITFWREGRGDIFCLKESDEKACVFIIRHFNSWNSPEDATVDILNKYSQQVKDFEIYDRHETFSADGYHAYWAGAHFSIDGKNYETGHLFVQVNNEVFQIMSYATRGIVEKYRQELNHITESFSLSRSE